MVWAKTCRDNVFFDVYTCAKGKYTPCQVATATYGRINEWEQVHHKDMVLFMHGGRRMLGKLEWLASATPEDSDAVHFGAVTVYELLEASSRRDKWRSTGRTALCELQHMLGAG